MIRILLVDDNTDYRQAFCRLLERQADIEVVGLAGSLAKARQLLRGVDLALIDRGLADGDGLELISELREASPGAAVLVMSTTLEQAHPEDAVEAGADGLLDKIETPEQIFATIREAGRLGPLSPTHTHPK
jgi:two-component system response regulator DevR